MAHTIACLRSRTNKAGRTSFYWEPSATLRKAGWPPVALGRDEGAAFAKASDINRAVAKWKAHGGGPANVRPRPETGTLAALIERYKRDRFEGKQATGKAWLAPGTIEKYRTPLARLDAWAGKQPLAWVTPGRVAKLRDAMIGPGGIGHHPAFETLKMGRTLFRFAISIDLIDQHRNPFKDFDLGAPDPRDVIWSSHAREAMIAAALELGHASMALAIQLGFVMAQRPQDFRAMTIRQYKAIYPHEIQPEDHVRLAALAADGTVMGIEIRQLKTRTWIKVPIVGEVRAAVEAAIGRARAAGALTILIDDTRSAPGKPKTYGGKDGKERFERDFAACRTHAIAALPKTRDTELADELASDLDKLQFRDLRRSSVVFYGEQGLDVQLIAGITGHSIDETTAILKTYLPRTTGRAARAIAIITERAAREARAISDKEKRA